MKEQEVKSGQRLMKLVLYQCRKCGAFDCPLKFEHEQYSTVIVCASCHAGSGMKPEEQLARAAGGFVIREQLVDLNDLTSLPEARKAMQA